VARERAEVRVVAGFFRGEFDDGFAGWVEELALGEDVRDVRDVGAGETVRGGHHFIGFSADAVVGAWGGDDEVVLELVGVFVDDGDWLTGFDGELFNVVLESTDGGFDPDDLVGFGEFLFGFCDSGAGLGSGEGGFDGAGEGGWFGVGESGDAFEGVGWGEGVQVLSDQRVDVFEACDGCAAFGGAEFDETDVVPPCFTGGVAPACVETVDGEFALTAGGEADFDLGPVVSALELSGGGLPAVEHVEFEHGALAALEFEVLGFDPACEEVVAVLVEIEVEVEARVCAVGGVDEDAFAAVAAAIDDLVGSGTGVGADLPAGGELAVDGFEGTIVDEVLGGFDGFDFFLGGVGGGFVLEGGGEEAFGVMGCGEGAAVGDPAVLHVRLIGLHGVDGRACGSGRRERAELEERAETDERFLVSEKLVFEDGGDGGFVAREHLEGGAADALSRMFEGSEDRALDGGIGGLDSAETVE